MYRYFIFADDTKVTFAYEPGDQETLMLLTDDNIQQKYKPDLTGDGLYRIPLIQVFDSEITNDTLVDLNQRAVDAMLNLMPDPISME